MAETTSGKTGMDPKLAGLLSWIFAPVTSIIFMLMEDTKKDEFVLFHAKQSLVYSIAQIILFPIGLVFMFIPVVGVILNCGMWLVHLAFFAGRIYFAIKAYNGEKIAVPLIGGILK